METTINTNVLKVIAEAVAGTSDLNKAIIYAYASGMADQKALSELEGLKEKAGEANVSAK